MKRFFQRQGRWLRLLLASVPVFPLLFFPAPALCAEAARPGFVMDMTPLLGEDGRIKAIAPGCRAMTGIVDGRPIVWSRDFGLVRLIPPKGQYGMGDFLSDDGRSMAGFVTNRQALPSGSGMAWARPGFIWRYGAPMQSMAGHGLVDVVWYGLSADGRVALGYGQKPIPGAPAADAPFEEHARFAQTPEGRAARSRGFLTHAAFWFCIEDGRKFRRMDELGTIETSPYFRVLSRDGRSILQKKENAVHIIERKTGRSRQLTFGGALPFAGGSHAEYGKSIIRPGDPKNPLLRWGRLPGFGNGRLFADSKLGSAGPDSPMYRTWLLKDFFSFIPSFDARLVLADVFLQQLDGRRMPGDSRNLQVLARLDEAGNGVVIDDGANLMAQDISDDGRIVLYRRGVEIRIWNEDFILPGDVVPRSMPLAEYLERHGLVLPEGRSIVWVVMSPDGRCFYLELADDRDETAPYSSFLACTDPAIVPPRWTASGGKSSAPAR